MRNFGLHKTVTETETAWSEAIGFLLASSLITLGIGAIAALLWVISIIAVWP